MKFDKLAIGESIQINGKDPVKGPSVTLASKFDIKEVARAESKRIAGRIGLDDKQAKNLHDEILLLHDFEHSVKAGETLVASDVGFHYTGGPDGVDFELTLDGKKHKLTIVDAKALFQAVQYALYTFKKQAGK